MSLLLVISSVGVRALTIRCQFDGIILTLSELTSVFASPDAWFGFSQQARFEHGFMWKSKSIVIGESLHLFYALNRNKLFSKCNL